jgi:hypothetical protein
VLLHELGAVFVEILEGQVIVGAILSTTVTVNEQVELLPDPSITLNVLVVVPNGKVLPEIRPAT